MRAPIGTVSGHCPPLICAALIAAAEQRDHAEIDRITDRAARDFPALFVPRSTLRPQFASKGRDVALRPPVRL